MVFIWFPRHSHNFKRLTLPKVVSLLASATEIVCALGGEDDLVGRSHECDYPASICRLPICTSAYIDTSRSSLEIDQSVKEHLRSGAPIYRVDQDRLRSLAPDVIVTQSHCEVCAVSRKDIEAVLGKDLLQKATVVTLTPNRLEDVWNDVVLVAKATGRSAEGQRLLEVCRQRMQRVAQTTSRLKHKPRVACLEWIQPLMAAGNWVPELVEMAGGANLFGHAGEHSPWMDWADLVREDPEVIVVMPCGFDLVRVRKEMVSLVGQLEWSELNAVKNKRVYLVDGNQYFNRPGPRLVESLEIFAELFHPGEFNFGHHGAAWEKYAE